MIVQALRDVAPRYTVYLHGRYTHTKTKYKYRHTKYTLIKIQKFIFSSQIFSDRFGDLFNKRSTRKLVS